MSLPRINSVCKLADRGHFVVYSVDNRRFVVPLAHLHTKIFRELFRISEEVFGLPTDGPIVLPFDAAFLEYVVHIVQSPVRKGIENAVIACVMDICS